VTFILTDGLFKVYVHTYNNVNAEIGEDFWFSLRIFLLQEIKKKRKCNKIQMPSFFVQSTMLNPQ